jgi:hypothetical protein
LRFANIKFQGKESFAFSKSMGGGSNWILWSDYAKEFSNDKVVSGVSNFLDFVKRSEILKDHLKKNEATIQKLKSMTVGATDYANPFIPLAFRDFYCFEEHVMTARKGRGLEMIPSKGKKQQFTVSVPIPKNTGTWQPLLATEVVSKVKNHFRL